MAESLPAALVLPVLASFALLTLAVAGASHAARERTLAAAATPALDGARLLRQRRRVTAQSDRLLWRFASSAIVPVAALMVAFVPIGGRALAGHALGVVWVNALDVTAWALWWLLGWSANSVTGLIGAYRFLALALGYELPLMFAITGPAIAAGSLDLAEIAAAQDGLWYVVWMPVAFLAYCAAITGFSVRPPLDAPAGTDLAGGVLAELAGVDRLLVLAGRYALLVAGCAVAVTLFLGGGAGPLLPGWAWLAVKTAALSVALDAAGRRVPTLRPDRMLEAGWVVALPLVVVQLLIVALVVAL